MHVSCFRCPSRLSDSYKPSALDSQQVKMDDSGTSVVKVDNDKKGIQL